MATAKSAGFIHFSLKTSFWLGVKNRLLFYSAPVHGLLWAYSGLTHGLLWAYSELTLVAKTTIVRHIGAAKSPPFPKAGQSQVIPGYMFKGY